MISTQRNVTFHSERTEQLANLLGKDICYAVSNGKWKVAKQLLLGMTVRHITGSAEIVSILNHFGHCASHSVLLVLETAMCNEVIESHTSLPTTINIDKNIVTHFC